MRLNWGHRIALLYIGFAGMIVYLITRSVNEKIDLVTPEYYAAELKYQEKIESIRRNSMLKDPVSIKTDSKNITVVFPGNPPGEQVTGNILLFRPSDKNMDKKYEINVKTGSSQNLPVADLQHGLYRVQINYSLLGNDYFTEKEVFIYKNE